MGEIKKTYRLSFSKHLSDRTLLTITAGTEIVEEDADADELAEKVRRQTRQDLAKAAQADPIVKEILQHVKKQIKRDKKIERAYEAD